MNTTLKATLLSLLLALGGAAVLAQQDTEPADETDSAEQAEDTPAPDEATTDDDGSPFDYQASEQISEDRSVSFPVDI